MWPTWDRVWPQALQHHNPEHLGFTSVQTTASLILYQQQFKRDYANEVDEAIRCRCFYEFFSWRHILLYPLKPQPLCSM
jgi:hypothetical protein